MFQAQLVAAGRLRDRPPAANVIAERGPLDLRAYLRVPDSALLDLADDLDLLRGTRIVEITGQQTTTTRGRPGASAAGPPR